MIDLHLHLDGSLTEETIRTLAQKDGVELPEPLSLFVTEDCQSLVEYLEKFDLPLSVLQSKENITYAVSSLLARLREQGLVYAEIRFAPQFHQRKGLTQEEVVLSAIEGLKGYSANLILCCMRGFPDEENKETVRLVKKYLGKGVCALDLAGDEAHYPVENYPYLQAGVPLTVHAGEAAGEESVQNALKLGANRIGHGTNGNEKDMKNVVIESCFTSNLQTKATSRVTYPIKEFLKKGVKVCLNTDNMTVSNTTLKEEYRKVMAWGNFTIEEMKTFALNGADGAFVSKEEKEILKEKINRSFYEWLA